MPFTIIKFPLRQIKRLYNWTLALAEHKHAETALFLIAFAESSFFLIPPDPLLLAMGVAKTKKVLRFAAICSLGSVIGGMFGYLIGYSFFEIIGQPIIDFYHLQDYIDIIRLKYENYAFLTILTAAFTPIPYKVITISAGLFKINFLTLIFASMIGRPARFFLIAFFLKFFGKQIAEKIEKYFDILTVVFFVILIAGFVIMKKLA